MKKKKKAGRKLLDMARKQKKVVKKKPARTKTKVAPSKEPGVDLDVMLKRKPAKKVVKTKIKKPKARKADTLPPLVITPRGSKYGDEPFVRTRKIPKDITKRTPRAVPKRKVPMRKSAAERERRVKFAKENPLMPRRQTPPSLPTRLRGRPALDTSMLLAPLGLGGIGAKGAKAIRGVAKRGAAKKSKRKGLGAGLKAGAGAGAGLGPLGMIGGALSGAMAARPAMSALRKLAATKAAKDKRGAARRKKPRKRVY